MTLNSADQLCKASFSRAWYHFVTWYKSFSYAFQIADQVFSQCKEPFNVIQWHWRMLPSKTLLKSTHLTANTNDYLHENVATSLSQCSLHATQVTTAMLYKHSITLKQAYFFSFRVSHHYVGQCFTKKIWILAERGPLSDKCLTSLTTRITWKPTLWPPAQRLTLRTAHSHTDIWHKHYGGGCPLAKSQQDVAKRMPIPIIPKRSEKSVEHGLLWSATNFEKSEGATWETELFSEQVKIKSIEVILPVNFYLPLCARNPCFTSVPFPSRNGVFLKGS